MKLPKPGTSFEQDGETYYVQNANGCKGCAFTPGTEDCRRAPYCGHTTNGVIFVTKAQAVFLKLTGALDHEPQ